MGAERILLLSLVCAYSWSTSAHISGRWCVTSDAEKAKCDAMKKAFEEVGLTGLKTCVQAPGKNRFECMRMIRDGKADLVRLDDTDIFSAGKVFGLKPILKESFSTDLNSETFLYKAVMVVKADGPIRSLTDLYLKKSCHTGVGRTVGWTVPVANLQAMGLMVVRDCDNTVKNVAAFFKQSCAPGAYSSQFNPDGDNPVNVCSLCDNNSCPMPGQHNNGYEQAFKCLKRGMGDVAFLKHSTIQSLIDIGETINKGDYRLVCPDGSVKLVDEWAACYWATRPTDVIATSSANFHGHEEDLRHLLEQAAVLFNGSSISFNIFDSSKFGGVDLIFSDGVKKLYAVGESQQQYDKYLDKGYLNTLLKYTSCNATDRWCVISGAELSKCQEFSAALASHRITHNLECVHAHSHKECMEMIEANQADLVTLDGADLYTAGKYHNLVPIAAEDYGDPRDDPSSYWAVAVVRKSNTDININTLQGKTSCHTGIGRTSGWVIPVGILIERGAIHAPRYSCDLAEAVGQFFRESCVPGALDPKYNPKGRNPENLCNLCGGSQNCQRSNDNIFYGYRGAFRCLVEKNADVAFVKHSTVPSFTDGKGHENWSRGLQSSDFELLCLDGSRKPVSEWRSCNLARVPSHAVVTSGSKSLTDRRHYFAILNKAQAQFGTHSTVYNMFSSPGNSHDTMFDDETSSLTKISEDYQHYQKWLGADYLAALKSVDLLDCVGSASAIRTEFFHVLLFVAVVYFNQ